MDILIFCIIMSCNFDSYGRFTRGNVDREIDFAHAQFVYSHAEIKVPMPKSPNTSKFAGISSLWIYLYVQNHWLKRLQMTLPQGNMKSWHFPSWPTLKNWKNIRLVGETKWNIFFMLAWYENVLAGNFTSKINLGNNTASWKICL